jgi:aryl-alcohol dehydrogenase-like predicted oxidoreductase
MTSTSVCLGALEALEARREEGLIRNIGVTGHVWPLVAKAVATGRFDTVLCWSGLLTQGSRFHRTP